MEIYREHDIKQGDQMPLFFRDTTEFSLLSRIFQRQFGTPICPGLGQAVKIYPGLEIISWYNGAFEG